MYMRSFDVLTTTFYFWSQVTWWVGRGNSYVLVACDLKANGTMDHNARTEYSINGALFECIAAATTKGRNSNIRFKTKATSPPVFAAASDGSALMVTAKDAI